MKQIFRSLILIFLLAKRLNPIWYFIYSVTPEIVRVLSEIYDLNLLRIGGTLDRNNFSIINRKMNLEDKFIHLSEQPQMRIIESKTSISQAKYETKNQGTIFMGKRVEFVNAPHLTLLEMPSVHFFDNPENTISYSSLNPKSYFNDKIIGRIVPAIEEPFSRIYHPYFEHLYRQVYKYVTINTYPEYHNIYNYLPQTEIGDYECNLYAFVLGDKSRYFTVTSVQLTDGHYGCVLSCYPDPTGKRYHSPSAVYKRLNDVNPVEYDKRKIEWYMNIRPDPNR